MEERESQLGTERPQLVAEKVEKTPPEVCPEGGQVAGGGVVSDEVF